MTDPERGNRLERSDRGPMGPSRRQPEKPVIAAIEGHAVAGGLALALAGQLAAIDDGGMTDVARFRAGAGRHGADAGA